MVVVHERRHGGDLHRVGVVGGVLEQAVVRVEELPGQQEEELPRRAAVVEALLAVERHVQLALLEVLLGRGHDLAERVLEEVFPPDVQLELAGALAVALGLELAVEVPQLGLEVPAVGGGRAGVGPRQPGASLRRQLRGRRARAGRHRRHVAHNLLLEQAEQDGEVDVVGHAVQRRGALDADGVHLVAQRLAGADERVPLPEDVHDVGLPQEGHHLLVVGRGDVRLAVRLGVPGQRHGGVPGGGPRRRHGRSHSIQLFLAS